MYHKKRGFLEHIFIQQVVRRDSYYKNIFVFCSGKELQHLINMQNNKLIAHIFKKLERQKNLVTIMAIISCLPKGSKFTFTINSDVIFFSRNVVYFCLTICHICSLFIILKD